MADPALRIWGRCLVFGDLGLDGGMGWDWVGWNGLGGGVGWGWGVIGLDGAGLDGIELDGMRRGGAGVDES